LSDLGCPTIKEQANNPHKVTVDPRDPNLLNTITKIYLDPKIVGEDKNKQLLFLVACSTFTANPLSAIVKGPSSAGKSYLVNRVLDIFRRLEMVIQYSRMTPAFLENLPNKDRPPKPRQGKDESNQDYLDRLEEWKKNLPKSVDLKRKILFIDEFKGIQNTQAPKLIISEGKLTLGTVDINRQSVELEVTGTPSIISTTTQPALEDPEFENRVLSIQIDETQDQTGQILGHIAKRFADPAEDLTEELRLKQLVNFFHELDYAKGIANPFGDLVKQDYPSKNIQARREFSKLLSLANVVTWLYQQQRRQAKKGFDIVFVTDLADIDKVKSIALGSLRESLAGLSEKEQVLLDYAKSTLTPLSIRDFVTGTRRTVRRSDEWVRQHVKRMAEEGYLEPVEENKKPFTWQYSALQPETLEIQTEKYSNEILSVWAEAYGYQFLNRLEFDLLATQGQAKSYPLSDSKLETYPNSDFGKPALATPGTGQGQALKEHSNKPNPNVTGQIGRDSHDYPAATRVDSLATSTDVLVENADSHVIATPETVAPTVPGRVASLPQSETTSETGLSTIENERETWITCEKCLGEGRTMRFRQQTSYENHLLTYKHSG
jgi:hypothetical protein